MLVLKRQDCIHVDHNQLVDPSIKTIYNKIKIIILILKEYNIGVHHLKIVEGDVTGCDTHGLVVLPFLSKTSSNILPCIQFCSVSSCCSVSAAVEDYTKCKYRGGGLHQV